MTLSGGPFKTFHYSPLTSETSRLEWDSKTWISVRKSPRSRSMGVVDVRGLEAGPANRPRSVFSRHPRLWSPGLRLRGRCQKGIDGERWRGGASQSSVPWRVRSTLTQHVRVNNYTRNHKSEIALEDATDHWTIPVKIHCEIFCPQHVHVFSCIKSFQPLPGRHLATIWPSPGQIG